MMRAALLDCPKKAIRIVLRSIECNLNAGM